MKLFNILFSLVFFTTLYEGDSGGGGPSPEPSPEPSPTPSPEPAPAPAPSPEPAFHESIQDTSLKEWVQGKGFKDAEAVVKSAFNLEKMVGAPAEELVRVPAKADESTMREVFSKLGMPETADKYEIPTVEGLPVDEGFQNWAKEAFHKAGLTTGQAKTFVENYNEYLENAVKTSQEEAQAKFSAEEKALKQEWGNGYDRQMRLAETAAQQLGFDEDTLNAIESQKGFAGTMKFMAELGSKLGEDNFVSGESDKTGFHGQMTPQEAKAAWASMTTDPEKMKALSNKSHPAHKETLAQKQRLFQIMHPEQSG